MSHSNRRRSAQKSESYLIRFSSGTLKGKSFRFRHPKVRPTTQKVRESILSICRNQVFKGVQFDSVCVPFAGSGATGFDFYSAFGSDVHFIDTDRAVIRSLKDNAREIGIPESKISTYNQSIRSFAAKVNPDQHTFNALILDPPYHHNWSVDESDLQSLFALPTVELILYECHKSEVPGILPDLYDWETKTYGDTAILVGIRCR